MTPYYQDESVTIYHGDCREVLLAVSADLLVTDPPYGIASAWKGGFSRKHGWAKAYGESIIRNQWDSDPPSVETISLMLSRTNHAVIWGGNYFQLPTSRGWLVWNKPERGFSLSEAELAWTSRDSVIRVLDWRRSDSGREHPTEKPERVMSWSMEQFDKCKSVLDPFMGSGTTLVAAKRLGRKAIGIELEERYCEIAANRCRQGALTAMFETGDPS